MAYRIGRPVIAVAPVFSAVFSPGFSPGFPGWFTPARGDLSPLLLPLFTCRPCLEPDGISSTESIGY